MSAFDKVTERRLNPWGGVGRQNLDSLNNQISGQLLNPWQSYDEWQQTNQNTPGLVKDFRDQGQALQPGLGQASDYFSGLISDNEAGGRDVPNEGLDMAQVALMADNPYMTGMIDAVSRDVTRNLYENQIPGIAGASAVGGNTGSSRRGAYEAIAERGAADRVADIGSTLRGNAYNQALGLESNRASQNAGFEFNAAANVGNLGKYGMDLQAGARDMFMGDQQIPMEQLGNLYNMIMPQEVAFGDLKETQNFSPALLAAMAAGGAVGNNDDGLKGVVGDILNTLGLGGIFGDIFNKDGDDTTTENTDSEVADGTAAATSDVVGNPITDTSGNVVTTTDTNNNTNTTTDTGNLNLGTGGTTVIPPVDTGNVVTNPPPQEIVSETGGMRPQENAVGSPVGKVDETGQLSGQYQPPPREIVSETGGMRPQETEVAPIFRPDESGQYQQPTDGGSSTSGEVAATAAELAAAVAAATQGTNTGDGTGGTGTGSGSGSGTGTKPGTGGDPDTFETLWGTTHANNPNTRRAAMQVGDAVYSEMSTIENVASGELPGIMDTLSHSYKGFYEEALSEGHPSQLADQIARQKTLGEVAKLLGPEEFAELFPNEAAEMAQIEADRQRIQDFKDSSGDRAGGNRMQGEGNRDHGGHSFGGGSSFGNANTGTTRIEELGGRD